MHEFTPLLWISINANKVYYPRVLFFLKPNLIIGNTYSSQLSIFVKYSIILNNGLESNFYSSDYFQAALFAKLLGCRVKF